MRTHPELGLVGSLNQEAPDHSLVSAAAQGAAWPSGSPTGSELISMWRVPGACGWPVLSPRPSRSPHGGGTWGQVTGPHLGGQGWGHT